MAMPSGKRSFREGFGFGVMSFSVGAFLGLLSTVVIARLYGIEVVGQYALATAPTGIVWFLSTVRERPALVRVIAPLNARDPRITGLFVATASFSVALTLVMSLLTAVATYLLFNGPIDQPGLIAPALTQLGVYVVLVNSCWMLDAIFSTFRAGRELFWIRLQQTITFVAFAGLFTLIEVSVWSLIGALAASWFLALVHRVVSVRQWMRFRVDAASLKDGFRELPDIIRFGLKLTPGSISQGLSAEAGTWILGLTSTVTAVGAWDRTWTIGKRMLDLNYRMSEMLLPTLVERHEQGDRAGFDRALIDSMRYAATLLLWPAAAVGGGGQAVLALLGPGFGQAGEALVAVMLVVPCTAVIAMQTQALLALDRPWLTSNMSIGRLVVTVTASVPLSIEFGVEGAAAAVLAGCVAQLVAQGFAVRRYRALRLTTLWPVRALAALAVAYVAGFAGARVVDIAIGGALALVPSLAAGLVLFALAGWACGAFLERDLDRLREMLERTRRRPDDDGSGRAEPSGPEPSLGL